MSTQNSSVQSVVASLLSEAPVKKTRRPRGEGSVRFDAKRKLWIATVPRPGQSPKTVYGKTQSEVLAKRDQYKADLASGRIDDSVRAEEAALGRNPTVGEWMTYWLETEIRAQYSATGQRESGKQPTTYANYRWAADKHILSRPIAAIRLDKLKVADVEVWWESMRRAKVGVPSAFKALSVLNGCITRAIKRRDVTVLLMNPASIFASDDRVRKPRAKKKLAPTPAGTQALFEAARGERFELLVHLGIRLGLRRQEILSLRFGDFDLARGQLHIRRRVNRITGMGVLVRGGAKMQDDDSEQIVPISNPERWLQLLEEHKQRIAFFAAANKKTWQGAEPTSAWAWLFPNKFGAPTDPNEALRWFKGVATRAGMPEKTIHGLRHDAASLGIESGMSLWEVSKLLRHASTQTTEEVYGHITGSHETRLYSRVDNAIDAILAAPQGDAASS